MEWFTTSHLHHPRNVPVNDREGVEVPLHGKSRGMALAVLVPLFLVLLCGGCDKPPAEPEASIGKASTAPTPAERLPLVESGTQPSVAKPNFKPIKFHAGKANISAEIEYSSGEGYYDMQITVGVGQQKYELDSALTGQENLKTVTQRLKKTIGWKGPYLFVRSECGRGNSFRCDKDYVFKLSGKRLIKIGETAVWETMPGGEELIGPGYQHGYFLDIWNGLEENDLTSHAEAPSIKMSLQDRDDKLVMHKDQTWKLNLRQYRANETELRQRAKQSTKSNLESFELKAQLLFNTALAKLTGRKQEYQETLDLAKRVIEHEGVARLDAMVSGTSPRSYTTRYISPK